MPTDPTEGAESFEFLRCPTFESGTTVAKYRRMRHVIYAITGLFLLVGCASKPMHQFTGTAVPWDEIQKLDDELKDGQEHSVDVLAAKPFTKAGKHLANARTNLADNDSSSDVLREVAKGWDYLDQAKHVSLRLHPYLKGVLKARRSALEAGADKYPVTAKKFTQADGDLKDDAAGAPRWSFDDYRKMQDRYGNLEFLAIAGRELGQALAYLNQAKADGAEDSAPDTYRLAVVDYLSAERELSRNRSGEAEFEEDIDEATTSAKRLNYVVAAMKASSRLDEKNAVTMFNQEQEIKSLRAEAYDLRQGNQQYASNGPVPLPALPNQEEVAKREAVPAPPVADRDAVRPAPAVSDREELRPREERRVPPVAAVAPPLSPREEREIAAPANPLPREDLLVHGGLDSGSKQAVAPKREAVAETTPAAAPDKETNTFTIERRRLQEREAELDRRHAAKQGDLAIHAVDGGTITASKPAPALDAIATKNEAKPIPEPNNDRQPQAPMVSDTQPASIAAPTNPLAREDLLVHGLDSGSKQAVAPKREDVAPITPAPDKEINPFAIERRRLQEREAELDRRHAAKKGGVAIQAVDGGTIAGSKPAPAVESIATKNEAKPTPEPRNDREPHAPIVSDAQPAPIPSGSRVALTPPFSKGDASAAVVTRGAVEPSLALAADASKKETNSIAAERLRLKEREAEMNRRHSSSARLTVTAPEKVAAAEPKSDRRVQQEKGTTLDAKTPAIARDKVTPPEERPVVKPDSHAMEKISPEALTSKNEIKVERRKLQERESLMESRHREAKKREDPKTNKDGTSDLQNREGAGIGTLPRTASWSEELHAPLSDGAKNPVGTCQAVIGEIGGKSLPGQMVRVSYAKSAGLDAAIAGD